MGRIDVHFHIIPQFFREAAAAAGRRPALSSGLPAWTPELALDVMDRNGIDTAITSISQPGVHFGDDAQARALARRCNEYAADCVERWPGRFGSFAVLPLPDIKGAIAETRYVFDRGLADGVVLFASYGERYLGDPEFAPVLAALDERAAVVFIHPALHPSVATLRLDLPAFAIEYPFDTTRAVTQLMFSGALDRYPNIRFILAHAGGTLPSLAFRLAWSPTIDAGRLGKTTADQVRGYLSRFWYDTALSAGPASLAALKQIVDTKQILFGSDWPYAKEPVTGATVAGIDTSEVLSDDEKAGIRGANAQTLFPRLLGEIEAK
jgi:predicted TIM-barrel fold metal-dependent hydrolase